MRHLQLKFAPTLFLLGVLFVQPRQQLAAQAAGPAPKRATTLLNANLPPHMDGDRLRAALVKVHYGPAEFSQPHSHGCPVIVYVLNGSVRSQIKGQPEELYHAGDSFYEPPNGVHLVSANASNETPAEILAFFVCSGDAAMSSAAPKSPSGGQQ